MNSPDYCSTFTGAKNVSTYDILLFAGRISHADVRNSVNQSGLHVIPWLGNNVKTGILQSYLLTCYSPADVNGITSFHGYSPIWMSACNNNSEGVKVLIDFGADRTIKNRRYGMCCNMTPLDGAIERDHKESIKVLTEYVPSEEDKLASQLECKKEVDLVFKHNGNPRFQQDLIDLKYDSLSQCIDAVNIGDLNLLTQFLIHVDIRMTVSLTLISIKKDQYHLMCCLLEKLVLGRAFEVRKDASIEPLLYIGFDAIPYSECGSQIKLSDDVVDIINQSLVLCFFKMLYHKFIYLDFDIMSGLDQILSLEELY